MTSYSENPSLTQSLTSRYSDWVLEALDELPDCFLITDPAIAGHPIVFASRSLLTLYGYTRTEILGKNARLFQGPATDRRHVSQIREAVREQRTVQISLLNYRKDGSPHWVLFHMSPVFGERDGRVIHFFAVQVPIPCNRGSPRGFPRGNCRTLASSCRDEMRLDENLRCDNHAIEVFDDMDNRVREAEESRVAGDWEKERALNAANNIVSALNRYSKLTGLTVRTKRCGSHSIPALSSALNLSLGRIKQSFVLMDPHLPDMPIVYASNAFLSLTGYSRCEVLGRNFGFLNGSGTDSRVLEEIKGSICGEKACRARLLNYRKDGSSFWNLLHISPVRNATGKIAYYVGVQMEEGSKEDYNGLSPEMWALGVIGSVKVAVRSLNSCASSSSPSR